jgi:hypothetical protein
MPRNEADRMLITARKVRAGQPRGGWHLRRDAGAPRRRKGTKMNRMMKRMALPVGAAIVLGSSGFAYMAVNSVPQSFAGAGENAISGYAVSGVSYNYIDNPGNPHLNYIKSVTFTLNHSASHASAQIRSTSANPSWVPYLDCSNTSGYTWTCANSSSQAADLAYFPGGDPHSDMLNVSAAQ